VVLSAFAVVLSTLALGAWLYLARLDRRARYSPELAPRALRASWDALGEDERRVLVTIAERLRRGRDQYGALTIATDRRDWRREAHEEALDLAVYLSIRTLSGRAARD